MPRNTAYKENYGYAMAGTGLTSSSYKCKRCGRKKPVGQYSNKQQAILSSEIRSRKLDDKAAQELGIASCKQCTSTQVNELCCAMCGEYKGLDEFAKTHRRNPDHAKCKICQEKISRTEPEQVFKDDDDGDSSESNLYEDDEEGLTSVNEYITDANGYQNTTSIRTQDGGVWLEQPRGLGQGSAAAGRPTFNPSAYGAPPKGGNVTGRTSQSSVVKSSKGGWAKPPKSGNSKQEPLDLPPSSDEDDDDDDDWNKKGAAEDSDDSGP